VHADVPGEPRSRLPEACAGRDLLRRHAAAVRPLKRRRRGDERPVHVTRVALRRLLEWLAVLTPLLPRRELRRVETRIRRALRLLGAVRDGDVALTLCTRRITGATEGWQWDFLFRLVSEIEEERVHAQGRLDRARLRVRRIRNEARTLSRALRGCAAPDALFFATAAKSALRELVREAGVAGGPQDVEGLHAVRLRSKHLRYLLEGEVTPAHPGILELAIALQRVLGESHDLALFGRRIERALGGPDGGGDPDAAREWRISIDVELADLHARARALLADPRIAAAVSASSSPPAHESSHQCS